MASTMTPLLGPASDQVLLESAEGVVKYRNKKCSMQLTGTSLIITHNNKNDTKIVADIDTESVIGAAIVRTDKKTSHSTMAIYYYPIVNKTPGCCGKKGQEHKRKRKVLNLVITADDKVKTNWLNAINCVSSHQIPWQYDEENDAILPPTRRKYLVFINPVSGRGLAVKIWKKYVQVGILISVEVFPSNFDGCCSGCSCTV